MTDELRPKSTTKLLVLVSLLVTAILIANILASKLFSVFGLVMTAGIIAYPLTFLVTDVINEVWGRKRAQSAVWMGFMANVLMLILFQIGLVLPSASFWGGQPAFEVVLGAVPRIVGASMVAYLISQTWDVWIFNKIKEKVRFGLWFRNNVSTLSSQVMDSAIFLGLAFGGVMPFVNLAQMFGAYILVKWVIAMIDTPFCYLGVKWVRGTINE